MTTEAIESAVNKLRELPEDRQQLAFSYIHCLSVTTSPVGDGNGLAALAGSISAEDADLMERAIEEAFEQIHPDDWKDLPRQ